MLEVRGKRALVTGAGTRLGRAIADGLVDAGAAVVFHHHGSAAGAAEGVARAHAAGVDAHALATDLSSVAEARALPGRAADLLGGLDLVVNSAALFERVAFADITPDAFEQLFAVNLRAPFIVCQAALPFLRQSAGAIVNLLDVAAERPWVGYAHYCASKAALHMLTRQLAKELAPAIRVNGVAPGAVLFPEGEPADVRTARIERIPLKREGAPTDVVEAVLYLWRSPYLTGVILPVDGGAQL